MGTDHSSLITGDSVVCVVGLGYVGLPLASAFAKGLKVIGFDKDAGKVARLSADAHRPPNLIPTSSPDRIREADFIIISVPTPVTRSKEPDLSYVKSAAGTVGRNMKSGSTIILESTVYPGVTEEIVKPILEAESGLRCGPDFRIGYSPERINPGDTQHEVERIVKVVSGMDAETAELVAALYRRVTPDVFKARDIRTAEAAKVIENIQRDLNIALMNELAIIFQKIGLNTRDVLEAAATKWNFHKYSPGLVGGHCIPVVPYYLVYKAREIGYHSQVILAGRAINDHMPKHVAEMTIKALNEAGKVIKRSRVLIMGLTYKEDVPDVRESQVKGIIRELKDYGVEVVGLDPLLDADDFQDEFEIRLVRDVAELKKAKVDGIILAVAHSSFCRLSLSDFKEMQNSDPVLIDVRGMFDNEAAERAGFHYKCL